MVKSFPIELLIRADMKWALMVFMFVYLVSKTHEETKKQPKEWESGKEDALIEPLEITIEQRLGKKQENIWD